MSISVLLTAWRRTELLEQQIEAIESQSVRPSQLGIWINHDARHEVKPWIKSRYATVTANPNMGVWPRFPFCLEFDTEYVAVFDDDTIPGKRWFENCLENMRVVPGLLGATGVTFSNSEGDRSKRVYSGACIRNRERDYVDIVGHCWFFKRDWIREFCAVPRLSPHKTAGEDYHFSYVVQQRLGLSTYVPPHPASCTELWGSLNPNIGTDDVALYRTPGEEAKKQEIHDAYRGVGWKLQFDRDKREEVDWGEIDVDRNEDAYEGCDDNS